MTPYIYIKKEIITGKLTPGTIFNENDVAKTLGVSRTPVREAVLKLANEGYLTIIPRKGTIVSNISFNDVKEVYELRYMLEPEIAYKAAGLMDKELCIKWKEYFTSLLNKKDAILPFETEEDDVDKLFHLSITNSLNNKLINKEIDHLMDLSQRIRYLSNRQNEQRYLSSLQEHIAIIDAIMDGNKDKAMLMMKEHLKNTIEGY
jgi:GntR family transcriptional regulator, rspAB operon transcriptional repressor